MAQERRMQSHALSIGGGWHSEKDYRRATSTTPGSPQSGHDNGGESRSLPQTIPMSRNARQEKLAVKASKIAFQEHSGCAESGNRPVRDQLNNNFDHTSLAARSLSFESSDSLSEHAFSFDLEDIDEYAQQELERQRSSQAGSQGGRALLRQAFGSQLGQAEFASPPGV